MPLTRPRAISNGVSLSDKLGRLITSWGFISEHGAVDSLLPAVVDELSPNKHGVSVAGSEHDVLAGADELTSLSSVSVVIARIVPFIEFETGQIAVFRDVPKRFQRGSYLFNDGSTRSARSPRHR